MMNNSQNLSSLDLSTVTGGGVGASAGGAVGGAIGGAAGAIGGCAVGGAAAVGAAFSHPEQDGSLARRVGGTIAKAGAAGVAGCLIGGSWFGQQGAAAGHSTGAAVGNALSFGK